MKADIEHFILSISESIAMIQDKENLFAAIYRSLQQVIHFDLAGITIFRKSEYIYEAKVDLLYAYKKIIDTPSYMKKFPMSEYPFKISLNNPQISRQKVTSILKDEGIRQKLGELLDDMLNNKINEVLHVPLMMSGELFGYLILAFKEKNRPTAKDIAFFKKISNMLAVALRNSILYEDIIRRNREKEVQIRLVNSLVAEKDRMHLFTTLGNEINNIININYMEIDINKTKSHDGMNISFVKDEKEKFRLIPAQIHTEDTYDILYTKSTETGGEIIAEYSQQDYINLCNKSKYFGKIKEKYNVNSLTFFLLKNNGDAELKFIIGKKSNLGFNENEIEFISQLLPQFSLLVKNLFSFEEINSLRKRLEQEKNYLLDENNFTRNSMEIIGNSEPIIQLERKINQIAPLDSAVLILGETGTGKELVARAIHNLSNRRHKPMVKINCAALPSSLIESELFGHEKGSFTGAIERRIGKFELANDGTIFLDEIGELPIELQSKLLRVIQEKEFERIGGKNVIKVNIRIITATNRNLEKEVEEGKFRADLFFRLNVFPIHVPPLRERLEDLPLLVEYFTELYSKMVGKPVKPIIESDVDMLMKYDWPGNIRELEHIIERSVITSSGPRLEIYDTAFSKSIKQQVDMSAFKPLEQMEKEYIISALNAANGKITGDNSASSLLKINGKTLSSKMRKLGIKREIKIV